MKNVQIALSLCIALASAPAALAAGPFAYPALNDYQVQATKLVQETQRAATPADRQGIIDGAHELIRIGVEINHLYGAKNPACLPQYAAFLGDLDVMETLPLAEAEKKYHDGVGLPAAPRHCYFGRSEIIHPVLNIIRLRAGWSETVREEVLGDFDEVLEHLPRIQRNLDTPPN